MNRALIFLLIRSVRGRIIRTLRLLKQPKYLLGIVVFFGVAISAVLTLFTWPVRWGVMRAILSPV